jgi:hypothetical protein
MESEHDRRRVPPYVSYRAFRACVGRLRNADLPERIRRETLGPRLSPSVRTQAMTALRFLGLIDELDGPTERLREVLAAFQTPGWRASLTHLLTDAYGALLTDVPSSASTAALASAFAERYRTKSDVARKCTAFFVHAARDAGLDVVDGNGTSSSHGRRARPARPLAASAAAAPRNGDGRRGANYELLLELLDPARMDEREQTAVWTLIRYVKRTQSGARRG